MVKLENLNSLLHEMSFDLRLELVLADLVADNLTMDEVLVMSNSLFKRNFHRDIEKSMQLELGQGRKKKLCFVVNREGIYDLLPEDMFHQPTDAQKLNSSEAVIQEIKWQNELEKSARTFFLPIEQEFYRLLVKLEFEEEKYLFETSGDLSGDLFEYIWKLPDFLDSLQKTKLGILIPALHKIVGKPELVKEIIESITQDKVEIFDSPPVYSVVDEKPQLGSMRLGDNAVLGGQISSYQVGKTLKILMPENTEIRDCWPGGKKMIIHEFLCNLLMPFETDITFDFEFSNINAGFVLEDDRINAGRLNYTTVI